MIPDKNISLAGKVVSRLGLGTMRLTGPGLWGPPIDSPAAIHLLRKAVHHHGINHIDTADSYGPGISELLIHEALHPYPKHLLIATKVGLTRSGPGKWSRDGRPEYLKRAVKSSLRRLSLEYMDLCYLHRIDPHIPFSDQLGALIELQTQGLIAHIGLSKVDSTHIEFASN